MKKIIIYCFLFLTIFISLFFIYQKDVMVFHFAIENTIGIISISAIVIVLVSKYLHNKIYFPFLGVGSFFYGLFVILHSLTVANIIEVGFTADLYEPLFLFSGFMLAISVFLESFHLNKGVKIYRLIVLYSLIFLALAIPIFTNTFSFLYIENAGYTVFRIILQTIVISLYVASGVFYFINRSHIKKRTYNYVVIGLITMISATFMLSMEQNRDTFVFFISHVLILTGYIIFYLNFIELNILDYLKEKYMDLGREMDELKKSILEVQKNERIFRNLYEDAPLGYQSLDAKGHLIHMNKSYLLMMGYTKEEILGTYFGNLVEEAKLFPARFKLFKEKGSVDVIFNMKRKDGSIFPARFIGKIARDESGKFKQTHCILMDISKDIEFQKSLQDSKKQLNVILNLATEGIISVNNDGIVTYINKNAVQMLGYDSEEELLGQRLHELIHHSYEDGSACDIEICPMFKAIHEKRHIQSDDEILWRKDKTWFKVLLESTPQIIEGKIVGAVVSFRDITHIKDAEDALLKMSYIDSLTGLYNRRFYENEINMLDTQANYPLSLIIGDINGLKLVNDAFGHQEGDKLIKLASQNIQKHLRKSDLFARIGGDEFVIVLPKTSEAETEKIINKITESISKVEVNSIKLSISFGHKTKTNQKQKMDEIYKAAEDLMYREKLLKVPSMRYGAIETIMTTLNEKDKNSEIHSRRVSKFAERLAIAAKLSRAHVNEIQTAGLLHDIGKIIIPSEILNKQGKLTEDEYDIIKSHSEIGFRILNSTASMRNIAEIVLMHHERIDGLGYPRGISKDELSIQAKIITIADSFEAMTAFRSYKKQLSFEEAKKELIRCKGTQFDADLIDIFIEHFDEITS